MLVTCKGGDVIVKKADPDWKCPHRTKMWEPCPEIVSEDCMSEDDLDRAAEDAATDARIDERRRGGYE